LKDRIVRTLPLKKTSTGGTTSSFAFVFGLLFILLTPVSGECRDRPVDTAVRIAQQQQRPKVIRDEDLDYPPVLSDQRPIVKVQDAAFLVPADTLREGVAIARAVPVVEFQFYPEQNYPGKPWSNWGDGTFANGRYYSAIGDHYAIGRGASPHSTGTAFVSEYSPESSSLRTLVDIAKVLKKPSGHYTPGKIHSRIDLGRDGWLYYATHRGSPAAANDQNHYRGDWIFRTHPQSGKTEVVAEGVIPKHSIPNSVLDPDRMIFYGGTAAGPDAEQQDIIFFAYDLKRRRLIYSGPNGPARYMMLARSTGRVYYVPGQDDGRVMRFDPADPQQPVQLNATMGIRAATTETDGGLIYAVSKGQRTDDTAVWVFDTKTEQAKQVGTAAVGVNAYVASIDVGPRGRYVYYVPGAHGGSDRDGSAVVQFDTRTGQKKVIAFLHPYFLQKYGITLKGTYSTAISDAGDKLFVTWNVSRGTRAWDCCGLTVIHIPESERVVDEQP